MKSSKSLLVLLLAVVIVLIILLGIMVNRQKLLEIAKYVLYSIVLAYILTPLSRGLEGYVPRQRAALILFLSLLMALILLIIFFIPILIRQAIALLERLPRFLAELQGFIIKIQGEMERLGVPPSLRVMLSEYMDRINTWFTSRLKTGMDVAVDGISKIAGIFTIPVLSYYFVKDRDYFKKIIMGIIPRKNHNPILRMAREINKILDRFIRGQILVASIVGILATIGYLIIGLPYAAIMGLFAGIFEIVPYLGPVLGAIPAAMVAILHSPTKLVATIIVVTLVQQLESNIFTPKIMGDHVGLHPVYIILGLWVAGSLFGIIGMFFAVPTILISRVILKTLYLAIVSDKEGTT